MQITLNQYLSELIGSGIYPSKSGKNPFTNFSKLVYHLATGKTYKELVEERKILKGDKIIDYLYKKEREKIPAIETVIIDLLSQNLQYSEIKNLLITK